MKLEAEHMYNWWLMQRQWNGLVRNARQQPARQDEVPDQRLEVNIPWLVALATVLVVVMSLCIGLSIIGAIAAQVID
jgi:hypothetical protein